MGFGAELGGEAAAAAPDADWPAPVPGLLELRTLDGPAPVDEPAVPGEAVVDEGEGAVEFNPEPPEGVGSPEPLDDVGKPDSAAPAGTLVVSRVSATTVEPSWIEPLETCVTCPLPAPLVVTYELEVVGSDGR